MSLATNLIESTKNRLELTMSAMKLDESTMKASPPPAPPELFPHNHTLLNPKFNSYKLPSSSNSSPPKSSSFSLPNHAKSIGFPPIPIGSSSPAAAGGSSSTIGTDSIGWRDARSRARWNHLSLGKKFFGRGGVGEKNKRKLEDVGMAEVAFVDGGGNVVVASLGYDKGGNLKPNFRTIFQIPLSSSSPFFSSSTSTSFYSSPDIPSVISLSPSPSLWLVSSGLGTLFLVSEPDLDSELGESAQARSRCFRLRSSTSEKKKKKEINDAGSLELEETEGDDPQFLVFRLHAATVSPTESKTGFAVLSTSLRVAPLSPPSNSTPSSLGRATSGNTISKTVFDLYLVKFALDLPTTSESTSSRDASGVKKDELEILWHLRGIDIPEFVWFDDDEAESVPEKKEDMVIPRVCIGSGGTFKTLDDDESLEAFVGGGDMDVDEEKGDQNDKDAEMEFGSASNPLLPSSSSFTSTISPSKTYSWNQTRTTVILTFPIPSSLPTKSIKCTFTKTHLSLIVANIDTNTNKNSLLKLPPLPQLIHKELYDRIDPDSCTWTIERPSSTKPPSSSSQAFLTLELEKSTTSPSRWPHPFHSDDGIEESMDPNQRFEILEDMERITGDAEADSARLGGGGCDDGDNGIGRGGRKGRRTNLMEDEEEEADERVGREVMISVVGMDGERKVKVLPSEARGEGVGRSKPSTLLSLPLPTIKTNDNDNNTSELLSSSSSLTPTNRSLIIKSTLDGLLFDSPSDSFLFTTTSSSSSQTELQQIKPWKHSLTYPALSFVLASKLHTRFVFHTWSSNHEACLAFESGLITTNTATNRSGSGSDEVGGGRIGATGNVFVYLPPEGAREEGVGKKGTEAIQKVVRMGGWNVVGVVGVEVDIEERRRQGDGGENKMDVDDEDERDPKTKSKMVLVCLCEDELVILEDVV